MRLNLFIYFIKSLLFEKYINKLFIKIKIIYKNNFVIVRKYNLYY